MASADSFFVYGWKLDEDSLFKYIDENNLEDERSLIHMISKHMIKGTKIFYPRMSYEYQGPFEDGYECYICIRRITKPAGFEDFIELPQMKLPSEFPLKTTNKDPQLHSVLCTL